MINGITIKTGASGMTVTGGSDRVYADDGLRVTSGLHVTDQSAADLTLSTHATFKNKPHALQSSGKFSKGIRTFNFTLPIILADGSISYQTFEGEFGLHPAITVAQLLEMRMVAAQLIIDSELDAYYRYGTTK